MAVRQMIDRAIEAVAPGVAEKRAISRHNLSVYGAWTRQGYSGGTPSRRRSSAQVSTLSEDRVNSYTHEQLIANCMDLYRNDPLTRSIVDVVDTYMGESRPMASSESAEWNALATEYFNDVFWKMADARRRPGSDFGHLQSIWNKYSWVGGDMLFGITPDGLMPYEGLQVATPGKLRADDRICNGIRTDGKTGRITHYYLTDPKDRNKFSRVRQSQAIFAPSKHWRSSMLRGAPELHAVAAALKDAGDVSNNVAGKIKFESMLFSVERKGAISQTGGMDWINKDTTKGTQAEHRETDYGMAFSTTGNPDQDFKLSNMNTPGSQHVPYMEHMGRIIAAGVGLPYEVVAHLYTNGSYTANRAARTDFMKFVMDRWSWRNKVLNQRVYNWAIARAIKHGQLPPAPVVNGRSQFSKCTWTLPHFPQIDEGKEIKADVSQWGAAVTSLSDLAQERGRTRTDLLDAHDGDIAEMKARAEALGVTLAEYANELFKASAAPKDEAGKE